MSGRIFLVIFFFWALLAIVTPTLVHLSESSKPYFDDVEKSEGLLKVRRMLRNLEKQPTIEEIAPAPVFLAPTPAPAPAPAPDPEPDSGIREAILKRVLKNS